MEKHVPFEAGKVAAAARLLDKVLDPATLRAPPWRLSVCNFKLNDPIILFSVTDLTDHGG